MRSFLIAALLVTSVFALPGASAKGFAEDAPGDTQTTLFGLAPIPVANPAADAADLLAMDVLEDAEELTFTIHVTSLDQQVNFVDFNIHFTWAKDEYQVVGYRNAAPPLVDEETGAYMYNFDSDEFNRFADLDHAMDKTAGTFTIHVPKAYLLDDRGRYPLLGDQLKDVYVRSSSTATLFQFSTDAQDRMPDGEDTLKYQFLFGDVAKGHLRLDADERVRVSNGGATTFVYQVVVKNSAEVDDEVNLVLSDMPESWNGTVQSPVRVPGGAERKIAVLISVPFAHDHGGFSSFNVTAVSARDPQSMASVRMGVLHTPIPQPAGHHSEMYLHAENYNSGLFADLFPFTGASFNTDANHDADAPEASPNGGGDGFTWYIPLSPMLRMGLDFDVEKTGEIAGNIIGHSTGAGTMRAELYLSQMVDGEMSDGIFLGDTDGVDVTLDLNNPAPFKLVFTPTEDADYIPYAKGQSLQLIIYYESSDGISGGFLFSPATTPGLTTQDFKMTLPLNEYHDKLTGLAETGESLSLKAEGLVEKTGLPGTTMTYTFTLTNHGASDEVIEIDLAGTDAEHGRLVPSGLVDLAAKESRTVTLAVHVPTGKNNGEELEVLVFAHAQEDPSKSAIARTKTIIGKAGSDEIVADEQAVLAAAEDAESKDTPGPGALFGLAAFAAAAIVMRRRK